MDMLNRQLHPEVQELLGVYALDATDPPSAGWSSVTFATAWFATPRSTDIARPPPRSLRPDPPRTTSGPPLSTPSTRCRHLSNSPPPFPSPAGGPAAWRYRPPSPRSPPPQPPSSAYASLTRNAVSTGCRGPWPKEPATSRSGGPRQPHREDSRAQGGGHSSRRPGRAAARRPRLPHRRRLRRPRPEPHLPAVGARRFRRQMRSSG